MPPPPEWLEECASSWAASTSTAIPTATPPRCGPRSAARHGVDPARVFCANGSNEVLQCLLPRLRRARACRGGVRADLRVAQPHRLDHRHGGGARLARPRPPPGPRCRRRVLDEASPVSRSCARPTTPPVAPRRPRRWRTSLERRPGPGGGGRGLRAVRPVERARPPGRRRAGWSAWWWCAPSPRRGRWRRAVWATSSPIPTVVAACQAVALPYHLDAMTQAAGRLALRHVDAMEARVALITEERGRIAAALGDLAVESWPSDANFILFRPNGPRRHRGVAGPPRGVGAGA